MGQTRNRFLSFTNDEANKSNANKNKLLINKKESQEYAVEEKLAENIVNKFGDFISNLVKKCQNEVSNICCQKEDDVLKGFLREPHGILEMDDSFDSEDYPISQNIGVLRNFQRKVQNVCSE